jgi:hypothetical protein
MNGKRQTNQQQLASGTEGRFCRPLTAGPELENSQGNSVTPWHNCQPYCDRCCVKASRNQHLSEMTVEQHGTSAALDSGNPVGRKLKASHPADGGASAVEPGGIAHRRFKASFVENIQFGRAIEALDRQALGLA